MTEEGLRERKKRQTRRRISDIATGLFMTRGFDRVTVADVARAADVSVNTVFNYFPAKEDLFFDREDAAVDGYARCLRDRRPGESAVAAFRREFLDGLAARDVRTGFHEGAETWYAVVAASPALTARLREIGRRATDALAAALADETGAEPDDPRPRAAAAMISAARETLVEGVVARRRAGETLAEMHESVRTDAERVFDLLEHGLGDYAVRPSDAAAVR
ncbi:TetR/AcrR family transcriptional regulator [Actinomadura atramentaria]|uniref:TetR/AcrR family transcriptional regulator n=1 Tax=Actinomadura atramentaria TaxID=1990 RepID=UPI001969D4A9|nr:TetR family transcriptional regulator [Actinomadura atramentaria]